MKTRLNLLFLCLMLFAGPGHAADRAGSSPAAASVDVADLRCEYLKDPLGIDVRQPRLSWRLTAKDPEARGLLQTAYRILVSSSLQRLADDEGDLWDSGEVASGDSAHIVYAGKPLASRVQCFWKVRVRDQAGTLSVWSGPACWSMGLLEPADWEGKWIGTDAVHVRQKGWPIPDNTMPDPWLRRQFVLADAPARAMLYVASIGYHEVYVNGRKVGDTVLAPCVTDHKKRARYCTYDIAKYLRPGKNVLGLWLGTSWSIFPPYRTDDKPASPLVLAQAEVELPGARSLRIATDATWRTHPSPNTLLGVWDFLNFGGELYDANHDVPNWCEADIDDADWKPAKVFSPRLTLSAEMVEPNRRQKLIQPIAIERQPGGEYLVDMGVNFAGFVEIDVHGKPGTRIEFQFSERADQRMTHGLHSAYVLGPSGKGTFSNRFNYSVGRWITIKGLDRLPLAAEIRGWQVRTDYRRAADFECSNDLLNHLYRTTLWTFENLSLGGYVVDCPHRERMGYGGDAHATTETALNSYHLGAFYTKWAEDWRDVQGNAAAWGVDVKAGQSGSGGASDDGNLPYTAPTYWGGGGPGWSGYCVALPWLMYRQYGDVRILEQSFPTIQRWLAFLETKATGGMLVRWGGEWDFLGDWLWPGAKGVNGDTPETLFFNNCYWIYNLQTAAQIADRLGHADAAAKYRRRAQSIRRAVHAKFFRVQDNSYVDGSQAYLSIALLVDLPPENLRPAVWKRLEDEILVHRRGHIHAGITGGYFVIKNLVENGRDDLVLAMAGKDDYPSWGDMLRHGATTFWESWEGDISLLHSSYLHLGLWFVEGLGGIQPDPKHGGFQSFVIHPGIPKTHKADLEWVRASYESPYGPITSSWSIRGKRFEVSVTVPPNTTATLLLPTTRAASIRESGRAVSESPGVKPSGMQSGRAVLQLQSGVYHFQGEL
ncbi:MAG: family 78 glycoside hydrolase catalytic domain [Thermoguttaceae bacterium]